jgi:chemotaxis protein methyltransferase CheR
MEGDSRLAQRDFNRLAALINQTSGIKMPPSKRAMVEGRLRRRVRELGFADFHDYCRYLFDDGGLAEEKASIIDAITTNKTDFFREPEHFTYLRRVVLPDLAARRRPMALWSAACSCGAEPYSLAMVVDSFAAADNLRWSILATDLSTRVLQQAAGGIYAAEMVAPVPPELGRRYLMRSRDRQDRRVRIVPELRARVHFAQLNLMASNYDVDAEFEVIFCRNVLIYFDKPTQEAVVGRLCRHLALGGRLFLGHSEAITGMDLPLKPVAPTVFVRT